jgi:ankyrin repeat protein
MLIAAGASVNDKNTTGETALYYSAQRADQDAVKALIEEGANVNAKNDKNMSPLHLAQLELAADRFSKQGRGPEHERQVQSVIDLLVAAGALPDPQFRYCLGAALLQIHRALPRIHGAEGISAMSTSR